jgi:hypothetical protein
MVVSKTVIHDLVKLLAGLWTLCSPPEPATFGLVQRPPEDRDVGVSQALDLHSNSVNIADEEGIVGAGGVGECCLDIEGDGVGVEAAPPLLTCNIDETGRCVPIYGDSLARLGDGIEVGDVRQQKVTIPPRALKAMASSTAVEVDPRSTRLGLYSMKSRPRMAGDFPMLDSTHAYEVVSCWPEMYDVP